MLLGRWTWAVDLHPLQITSASQGFQSSAHPPSNLLCPEKQELTSGHVIQAAAAFFSPTSVVLFAVNLVGCSVEICLILFCNVYVYLNNYII